MVKLDYTDMMNMEINRLDQYYNQMNKWLGEQPKHCISSTYNYSPFVLKKKNSFVFLYYHKNKIWILFFY